MKFVKKNCSIKVLLPNFYQLFVLFEKKSCVLTGLEKLLIKQISYLLYCTFVNMVNPVKVKTRSVNVTSNYNFSLPSFSSAKKSKKNHAERDMGKRVFR